MLAIFVTIKLKPGTMERFVEASLGDARGSVGDEPGCYRFDVLRDPADPNVAYLYEVYENEAAIEAHRETPHFLKWRATVKDWFDGDLQIVRMQTVFPSAEGYRRQKPYLVD